MFEIAAVLIVAAYSVAETYTVYFAVPVAAGQVDSVALWCVIHLGNTCLTIIVLGLHALADKAAS